MLKIHEDRVSCLTVLCFVMIVPCLQDANVKGPSETVRPQDVVKTYLDALEKFDRSNASCHALTSAIANCLKLIPDYHNFLLVKANELGSLLYAYAKLRPKVFTDVQGYRQFRWGYKGYRVHTTLRRNDGTLFVLCVAEKVEAVLYYMEGFNEKGKKDNKSFRWVKGDVSHTVGVDLWWEGGRRKKPLMFCAKFLIDGFNVTHNVKVRI